MNEVWSFECGHVVQNCRVVVVQEWSCHCSSTSKLGVLAPYSDKLTFISHVAIGSYKSMCSDRRVCGTVPSSLSYRFLLERLLWSVHTSKVDTGGKYCGGCWASLHLFRGASALAYRPVVGYCFLNGQL